MRVYGGMNTLPLECINRRLNKWRIRWDFKPEYNSDGEQEGVSFCEEEVNYKPSLDQIKEIVINGYNAEIDKRILSGFLWNGHSVYLSIENQFNYKAAYDLAIQTGGVNLPIRFKFGNPINPTYHEFKTIEDLSSFYMSAMAYIECTLSSGWDFKDSIDWGVYNIK